MSSDQTSAAPTHAAPADHLLALLAREGMQTEEIGDYETERIVNVTDADGTYLCTLTISRTPGY